MNVVALTQELSQRLQSEALRQLSSQLGISEPQTTHAISAALPLLFRALGQNIPEPTGMEVLFGASQRYHVDIRNLIARIREGDNKNDDILTRFFGNRQQRIVERLSKTIGLDNARTSRLLTMMAPIVLSFLTERLAECSAREGLDAAGLSHLPQPRHHQSGLSGDLVSIPLDPGTGRAAKSGLWMFGINLAGLQAA